MSFQYQIPKLSQTIVSIVALAALPCQTSWAISVLQVDEFTSGDVMEWFGADPTNIADPHPAQVGDRALQAQALGGGGSGSRLIIYNNSPRWGGDWTQAGIQQISMDVLNPNLAGELVFRLGISGPGLPGPFGSGNTYGSLESFSIPADNQWHPITFAVTPANWVGIGGSDITAALADVGQFRILHSVSLSFLGDVINARFLVDNIKALGGATDIDGDYNGDGAVNAGDYTLWRDTLGQMGANLPADGNGDEKIDATDYAHWKARFGNESGTGASELGTNQTIPEPAAASLALMLFLVVGLWRWFDLHPGENRI